MKHALADFIRGAAPPNDHPDPPDVLRRVAIAHALLELQFAHLDLKTALAELHRRFPDLTRNEFLDASKVNNRITGLMIARADAGQLLTVEVATEIDEAFDAYKRGEPVTAH